MYYFQRVEERSKQARKALKNCELAQRQKKFGFKEAVISSRGECTGCRNPDDGTLDRKCKRASITNTMKRSDYAFPCGGCICNHCANNLYSEDKTAGEAKIFCDACEWCRWYDGDTKNPDKWKQECDEYIITEEQAKRNRKKFKIVK